MFWPPLPRTFFPALALPAMVAFPSEPRFPMPRLKGPRYATHRPRRCNARSADPWWQRHPREGDSSRTDHKPSLPLAQPTLFPLTSADVARGCRPPYSPRAAGPAAGEVPAAARVAFGRGDGRRRAGCASSRARGQLTARRRRRRLRLRVLIAGIAYLWFNLPGARLYGLQLGFLVLHREISVMSQWANRRGTRRRCRRHRWLADTRAPTTSTSSNAWARSIKNWPAQTLPVGMSSWFLTWWHLQSLSSAHMSYQKLFLWSPVSWGVGDRSCIWTAVLGCAWEKQRDPQRLPGIIQGSRPTQFHVFSSAGRGGRESKRKTG